MEVIITGKGYQRRLTVPARTKVSRARWLGELSPEPETIAWIETMKSGELMFDVGANVGTFSCRAAIRGVRVYAFEPTPDHYNELLEVVTDNDLSVTAFPVGMSDRVSVGTMGRGRSSHTFHNGKFGKVGALMMNMDLFCSCSGEWPDYIKIDVDGSEPFILRGAQQALSNAKSVLIEIDPQIAAHEMILGTMIDKGFEYDLEQVEACMIKEGKYKGMANWIFRRL